MSYRHQFRSAYNSKQQNFCWSYFILDGKCCQQYKLSVDTPVVLVGILPRKHIFFLSHRKRNLLIIWILYILIIQKINIKVFIVSKMRHKENLQKGKTVLKFCKLIFSAHKIIVRRVISFWFTLNLQVRKWKIPVFSKV